MVITGKLIANEILNHFPQNVQIDKPTLLIKSPSAVELNIKKLIIQITCKYTQTIGSKVYMIMDF